jgi:hypothetical protein
MYFLSNGNRTPVVTFKSVARFPCLLSFVHIFNFQGQIVFECQGLPVYVDFFVPVKSFKGSLVINALYTIFT